MTWVPFRPDEDDLKALREDVSEVNDVQEELVENSPGLALPDRVAHQYQIAGGKVLLRVAAELPDELLGVGLFHPNAEYVGIGRISTGLGSPHIETNPDFLGAMAAFRTRDGQRVDFLGINHPAAPTDTHQQFVKVLEATAESAGNRIPLIGDLDPYDLGNLVAEQTEFGLQLVKELGPFKGIAVYKHIVGQALRTFHSSTAWQPYWTGIVEAGGKAGKVTFVPVEDVNEKPGLDPGERYLSEDWRRRQSAGDLTFGVYWIPYLDEEKTPTDELTESWEEDHKQRVGALTFPRVEADSEDAGLWAVLASEMGANPGNWVRDRENSVPQPATRFGAARKIAYQISQDGRGALPDAAYEDVFETGKIGPRLAEELEKRRRDKLEAGQISWAEKK